jgi:hypothetical protein
MNESSDTPMTPAVAALNEQMEDILRDFFHAELPALPDSPAFLNSLNINSDDLTTGEVLNIDTRLASVHMVSPSPRTISASAKFCIVGSMVVLALSAMMMIVVPTSAVPNQSQQLMPVSSQGDQPPSSEKVIGSDGLTIEEADGVQLQQ